MKIIITVFLYIIGSTIINAQDNPINKYNPISPNAASFAQQVQSELNGNNGAISVNIPLFTVSEGNIEVPVGLNYSSNGVKPNEEPGWVGRNWNLNAGGIITRSIKGLPDETNDNGSANGFLYSSNFPGNLIDTRVLHESDKQKDMEPDVFYFNFLGYSGKFYKNNVPSRSASLYEHLDVKMESVPHQNFQYNFKTSPSSYGRFISQITIITEDGTKYKFGIGDTDDFDYDING